MIPVFKRSPHLARRAPTVRISTETAVSEVLSKILLAIDAGDLSTLALLDLSSAFDTVDHAILVKRLRVSYNVGGNVLRWFESYLVDRHQHVRLGSSSVTRLTCGVPQVFGHIFTPMTHLPRWLNCRRTSMRSPIGRARTSSS